MNQPRNESGGSEMKIDKNLIKAAQDVTFKGGNSSLAQVLAKKAEEIASKDPEKLIEGIIKIFFR